MEGPDAETLDAENLDMESLDAESLSAAALRTPRSDRHVVAHQVSVTGMPATAIVRGCVSQS
jgi:hypothetical protein